MVFINLTQYGSGSELSLDSDRILYCKRNDTHGFTTLQLSVSDNSGGPVDLRVNESPSSITAAIHLHEAQIAANTEIMLHQHASHLRVEDQIKDRNLRTSFGPSS